jgi:hypothetical protein
MDPNLWHLGQSIEGSTLSDSACHLAFKTSVSVFLTIFRPPPSFPTLAPTAKIFIFESYVTGQL